MDRLARAGASLLRTRRLARAPLWLYRARVGGLLGRRMLMLEHVGRNSGRHRQAVLEVLLHPAPGTYVVASGFGERAQWYLNVGANRGVRVAVGFGPPRPATARLLGPAERAEMWSRYGEEHPRSRRGLVSVLAHTLGEPVAEDGSNLPMVSLQLAAQD